MIERIKKFNKEHEAIVEDLKKIMGYCDYSPISVELDSQFVIDEGRFLLQADDEPIDEDEGNYYAYTISSLSDAGEKLFIGEDNSQIYLMAYPEDERWEDTTIFVLSKSNRVEL
jgi:hypothetical protein